jgi:hypothetical protein
MPNNWPATNVMMLGKIRPSERTINDPSFPPSPRIDYLPTNVTELPGQNVIRQIVMNGVRGVRVGMGDVSATAPAAEVDSSMRTRLYAWGAVSMISGVASLYHGYKRNNSIGWGLGWYALGVMFPLITPTIAVAQGYGKRKGR